MGSGNLSMIVNIGCLPVELALVLTNTVLARNEMLIILTCLVENTAIVGASEMKGTQLILDVVVILRVGGSMANQKTHRHEIPGIPKLLTFQSDIPW